MRALVTGANGFIGAALCKELLDRGFEVTGSVRGEKNVTGIPSGADIAVIDNIGPEHDWRNNLNGIDTVVHLAARAHKMHENVADSLALYREVNVFGTKRLAHQAAKLGVKRFVYISSVKVNGENNLSPFNESDDPSPKDAYGISKMEGENEIKKIAEKSRMEYVIIRPPLVYGPGVKANFLHLMKLVHLKAPLPFARINNRRSLVFLGNLVDCIFNCMIHPAAANQTYMVSDDRVVSTSELIRLIASALEIRGVLFPFPQVLLQAVGKLMGKGDALQRLLGSLTVDISKIKNDLLWKPPFSVESGLLKTAEWFKIKQTKS